MTHDTYWQRLWRRFYAHRLGRYALYVVILFTLVGIYAPFLASSKPLFAVYRGDAYFPLFRYLFYTGFFTKRLDIFFNLLMFTVPLLLLAFKFLKGSLLKGSVIFIVIAQFALFLFIIFSQPQDPAASKSADSPKPFLSLDWNKEVENMSPYAKINLLLRYRQRLNQQKHLENYLAPYTAATQKTLLPTLWQQDQDQERRQLERAKENLSKHPVDSSLYQEAEASIQYILDRKQWFQQENDQLRFVVMPLLSPFHWEDDAGGQQILNQFVPWWDLTRTNRKDLLAALIFGTRISLTVGVVSVCLALLIGVPIGAFAGFYGGSFDIIVSRLLEIWESMPTFFMLLLAVGILQNKSIFLIILIIGLFGWTSFSRYTRGEFFKQRNLPYVEACRSLGFKDPYIMFRHILPNAIPPVLTLLPFAVMAAITSEAGLSFLGLGEEGSCSWGILMDEGRSAFPQESYLMWPPAILLTVLLIAIAIVGDNLRDTLDPKVAR